MAQKVKITAILTAARTIKAVWMANPDFKMGKIGLRDFIASYDTAQEKAREYARKRVVLNGLKSERDDTVGELNTLLTRFRSGMRSYYGPDSVQYAQSGARRASERRSPRRKKREGN